MAGHSIHGGSGRRSLYLDPAPVAIGLSRRDKAFIMRIVASSASHFSLPIQGKYYMPNSFSIFFIVAIVLAEGLVM